MLERYGHGGDWVTARELYGAVDGPNAFVDFSANMNPFGPPACVGGILRSYADAGEIARYPDPAVRGLRGKLADRHGVSADGLLAGNGAAELIELLFRALRPKTTVLAEPCFGEYREAAEKNGSTVRAIRLRAEDGFRLTDEAVERMLRQLRETGLAPSETLWILGSPNNPTGECVARSVTEKLLASGAAVALDEAFMDFAANEPELSLLREAVSRVRLVVIRSMTKFYAVPGIRLGYMAAQPALIRRLAALQVPWSVNSLAQRIGEAVLDEAEYAARTVAWARDERAWLAARLTELGLTAYGGAVVNYVLAAMPSRIGWTSDRLQEALGRQGILIRDASRFGGLDRRFFRIAVRLREDNETLLAALRALLARPMPEKEATEA
ncbi:pyridoxal phosphate-dependent aminotransferase [Paenibacillus sp. GCM10023250]|uniref:pyridoxal phosphate-dependent aminotransferase n=1 Tax=Paenibacillus sp. GCM10023250 TaxID=3252648 RepID=UPI00361FB2C3